MRPSERCSAATHTDTHAHTHTRGNTRSHQADTLAIIPAPSPRTASTRTARKSVRSDGVVRACGTPSRRESRQRSASPSSSVHTAVRTPPRPPARAQLCVCKQGCVIALWMMNEPSGRWESLAEERRGQPRGEGSARWAADLRS